MLVPGNIGSSHQNDRPALPDRVIGERLGVASDGLGCTSRVSPDSRTWRKCRGAAVFVRVFVSCSILGELGKQTRVRGDDD